MLDFYILHDDTAKPNNPKDSKLIYAGSLDYESFKQLQESWIIEPKHDYFSDLRFYSNQVKIKFELIISTNQTIKNPDKNTITAETKLLDIFSMALNNNSGLIAYSD